MTKSELWNIYVKRNPAFVEKETVTIKTDSLKRLFDQTWEQAEKHAREASPKQQTNHYDVLNRMFGGR